jgi:hypothetical protein
MDENELLRFTDYVHQDEAGERVVARYSDVTVRDLHEVGLIDDAMLHSLEGVLDAVDGGMHIFEDEKLLVAWLYSFELLSSVSREELERRRRELPGRGA